MIKRLLSMVLGGEIKETTITKWVIAFTGIVFIRLFLEQFSNQSRLGFIESDPRTFAHMFLFFLTITIVVALIISIFTKQKNAKVITLALCGLPIIWLAPIIDLLVSGGKGFSMAYMFETHSGIIFNFFTFFGPIKTPGITIGLHIELFISLCAIGWYVWSKRKNLLVTLGAVLLSYTFIFAALSLPGMIFTISHPFSAEGGLPAVVSFMNETVLNSNIPGNALHNAIAYKSTSRLLDIGFDTIVSQLFFLFAFVMMLVWSWYSYRNTLKKIFINARPERVLFYLSLFIPAVLYAQVLSPTPTNFIWIDWVGLIVLSVSWFSAWMYAVHINDLYDTDIDKISNPNRPLIKNEVAPDIFHEVGLAWLALSLVGSYVVGYYPFLMNIIFSSAYYIYSAPPLRLKRVPILSSFLNSVTCLATILAGFFFVSPDKMFSAFPAMYALGIVTVFTLNSNIRDLKDIAGDGESGIQTLPVLFGQYGRHVVGILLALSFMLLPVFLSFYTLYILALPAAIIGYKLCVRQPYKETYIFALYFAFCALTLILIFFLLSLIK